MTDDQAPVIAFLQSPGAFAPAQTTEVVQTHGAYVFLAGDCALKIKRAVCYDYMDLSTMEKREALLRRELALNQPCAPKIYHKVVPITQAPDGKLAVDGVGRVVEWGLLMWRFAAKDELLVMAIEGRFTDPLADDLGQRLYQFHASAPVRDADGAQLIGDILEELARVFADTQAELGADLAREFLQTARACWQQVAPILRARGQAGQVRRCHGDLHLRNLVMLDGHPVPFDALEFDETLGTCDVLYDLAFLLMDLQHRKLPRAANIVLNAWLLGAGGAQDDGLAALPLFLAVRAAIRAMVVAQTAQACGQGGQAQPEARAYLTLALDALRPLDAVLIAVGGISGSGKTTLARALAPEIGRAPGAVHLRSDLERKALLHVAAQTPLDPAEYAADARARVYRHMLRRAAMLLAAGQSVVLDATYLQESDRRDVAALAQSLAVRWVGVWLYAPEPALLARVTARTGDASDADAAVVQRQLDQPLGRMEWHRVATGGGIDTALAALRDVVLNA